MNSSMGRHPSDLSGTYSNTILTLVLDEYECVVNINSICSLESSHVLLFYNFEPQRISFDLFDTENENVL